MCIIFKIIILNLLFETIVCSSNPFIKVFDTNEELNIVFNNKLVASVIKSNYDIQQCVSSESKQCFILESNQRLEINETHEYFNNNSISCGKSAFINFPDNKEICFKNLASNTSTQWYGGGTDSNYNLLKSSSRARSPYYTGDDNGSKYGESVIEPVWISSSGIGIYVSPDSPLFMHYDNTRNGSLCFSASYDEFPFNSSDIKPNPKVLSWYVCEAPDVQQISLYAINNWFGKPTDSPDKTILGKPIWSTKSLPPKQINGKMNQTKVIEFAKHITSYNFSSSQIELKEDWQLCIGDWDFDLNSYPNPKQMVEQLKQLGFRITLWINGAVSTSCTKVYEEGLKNRYFVELGKTGKPAIDPKHNWTLIDFTNPSAQMWFNQKLQYLNSQYGINSFNFDDGEISPWIIPGFRLFNQTVQQQNPSYYSQYYAESTYKTVGNAIEIRVGFKTQNLPVFVRMLDKDSSWSSVNGIQSLIPNALLFSLYGYPFILPDIIGGNTDRNTTLIPDKELYIRWTQVTALLPSMQFSIPPWIYNDSQVLKISANMAQLHESFSSTFQDLAQQSVAYGFPIIRPIWWNNPTDQTAFTIDDQFMIGDETLVAPVITPNSTQRDIYLPTGNWIDENLGQFQVGPVWLRNYSASLDILPYFRKGQCNPCKQRVIKNHTLI